MLHVALPTDRPHQQNMHRKDAIKKEESAYSSISNSSRETGLTCRQIDRQTDGMTNRQT